MKVMCSWCVSEGKIAYLGVRGSEADRRVSHAICEGHLVQLRSEVSSTPKRLKSSEPYASKVYPQDSIASKILQ